VTTGVVNAGAAGAKYMTQTEFGVILPQQSADIDWENNNTSSTSSTVGSP